MHFEFITRTIRQLWSCELLGGMSKSWLTAEKWCNGKSTASACVAQQRATEINCGQPVNEEDPLRVTLKRRSAKHPLFQNCIVRLLKAQKTYSANVRKHNSSKTTCVYKQLPRTPHWLATIPFDTVAHYEKKNTLNSVERSSHYVERCQVIAESDVNRARIAIVMYALVPKLASIVGSTQAIPRDRAAF